MQVIPNVPGVYAIRNAPGGKLYVGSTADSLRRRWRRHRRELRGGRHGNRKLQLAWDLFGESAFGFDVLETCGPALCLEREQHWIDTLKAADGQFGYNLCPVAGNSLGRKFTDESLEKVRETNKRVRADPKVRAKLSEALRRTWDDPQGRAERTEANRRRVTPAFRAKRSEGQKKKWEDPEYRRRMSEAIRKRFEDPAQRAAQGARSRGRKQSPEACAKRSASLKGRVFSAEARTKMAAAQRGKKHSAETRAKLSAVQKGRKPTPEALANIRAALDRPETRAKMSASAKAAWARKRAAEGGNGEYANDEREATRDAP
jgi:group I intron endonuclease